MLPVSFFERIFLLGRFGCAAGLPVQWEIGLRNSVLGGWRLSPLRWEIAARTFRGGAWGAEQPATNPGKRYSATLAPSGARAGRPVSGGQLPPGSAAAAAAATKKGQGLEIRRLQVEAAAAAAAEGKSVAAARVWGCIAMHGMNSTRTGAEPKQP